MPGVYRHGINQLRKLLEPLVSKGLQSILLFGVSKHLKKVNTIQKPINYRTIKIINK